MYADRPIGCQLQPPNTRSVVVQTKGTSTRRNSYGSAGEDILVFQYISYSKQVLYTLYYVLL